MKFRLLIVLLGAFVSTSAYSSDDLNLSLPSLSLSQASLPGLQMAAASAMSESATTEDKKFNQPWLSWNKTHQYLGIASLALAGISAALPKPDAHDGNLSEEDIESSWHHRSATAAAYLGGAAVASGLVLHLEDIHWSKFYKDPDTWHALLGTIGTLGYFAAIAAAPEEMHATYGMAGFFTMAAAIKITW